MTIICDQLSLGIGARALRRKMRTGARSACPDVLALDAQDGPFRHAAFKTLFRLVGVRVEEAEFSADALRLSDGSSPIPVAREALNGFMLSTAEGWLAASPLLREINARWGRNTLLLGLMKEFYQPGFCLARRVFCAEAIALRDGLSDAEICLELPPGFAADHRWPLRTPGLALRLRTRLATRFVHAFRHLGLYGRMALGLLRRALKAKPSARGHDAGVSRGPALLILEEDSLGLDRTMREQPHWLSGDDPPFPAQVCVLGNMGHTPQQSTLQALETLGVRYLPESELRHGSGSGDIALHAEIGRDTRRLLRHGLGRLPSICAVTLAAARLLLFAQALSGLCGRLGIAAFFASETYFAKVTAMLLIAPRLGITTLSCQYSNVRYEPLFMLTTCDVMLTFSPRFHERWRLPGIGPARFEDVGYLFDHAFAKVSARAAERRLRLRKAGAQCILCYFDENFLEGRYSNLTPATHWIEYRSLLEACLDDKTLGLLLKPQFNSSLAKPRELAEFASRLAAEGRYEALCSDGLRSAYFPAEAAMSADFAIGDLIGGTATLEAALAGVRSLLINPRSVASPEMELYLQAGVIFPSLPEALEAIRRHRAGEPAYKDLGDWSPILDHFDPFRDGQAAARIRQQLEAACAKAGQTHRSPQDATRHGALQ